MAISGLILFATITLPAQWLNQPAPGIPKTVQLIDQFESWINAGKIDDAPKGAPLAFASLMQSLPPPFPGLSVQDNWPLLFVASMAGDDGRRNGDHAMPDVPLDHVPPHFWNTSQIYLTDTSGNIKFPPALKPTEEYYVAAVIGNAGNWGAGRSFQGVPPHMFVLGDALAFNTFMGPNFPLPALSNLDPAAATRHRERNAVGNLVVSVVKRPVAQ